MFSEFLSDDEMLQVYYNEFIKVLGQKDMIEQDKICTFVDFNDFFAREMKLKKELINKDKMGILTKQIFKNLPFEWQKRIAEYTTDEEKIQFLDEYKTNLDRKIRFNIIKSIENDDLKLYVDISVVKGYLENAKVSISNSNFRLKEVDEIIETLDDVKYIDQEGKQSLYYMGCYGIGVSRTVATLYEANVINDKNGVPCGFALPKNIAPYKLQIIPKMDNEEKKQLAEVGPEGAGGSGGSGPAPADGGDDDLDAMLRSLNQK